MVSFARPDLCTQQHNAAAHSIGLHNGVVRFALLAAKCGRICQGQAEPKALLCYTFKDSYEKDLQGSTTTFFMETSPCYTMKHVHS